MLDMTHIGNALRGARWNMNLTQTELAELAGVSRMTVVSLERGGTDARLTSVYKVLTSVGLELRIRRIRKRRTLKDDPPPQIKDEDIAF
jgi:DNA-binding XRE family transcriptional regulator